MKLLKYLLTGGIGLVNFFLIYAIIAIALISADQWNKGIVFYSGVGFAGLFIVSLFLTVKKGLK